MKKRRSSCASPWDCRTCTSIEWYSEPASGFANYCSAEGWGKRIFFRWPLYFWHLNDFVGPLPMMDTPRIDAEHMVARYLAGQLSAADEVSFDRYAADHPEILRDIESTLRLKEGLAVL